MVFVLIHVSDLFSFFPWSCHRQIWAQLIQHVRTQKFSFSDLRTKPEDASTGTFALQSQQQDKRRDRPQILSRLHFPPSHTRSRRKLLISPLQSSFTWNPFPFFPHLSVSPFCAMRACFLSIPAMFESIHPSFSILITPPQGLSAPPTESMLPSLLAPHRVGWQERRHRQQGVGRACQRVPPPRWVTGIRALLWSVYALYPSGRTLRRRGDSGPGGKVAPAIWRQRAGSTRPRGENKQVPRVLVLPLWPTSKQTECVSMCVCVPVQMKNLDSPTLNSTLFKDMDTCRAAAMERKRQTGRERDLLL